MNKEIALLNFSGVRQTGSAHALVIRSSSFCSRDYPARHSLPVSGLRSCLRACPAPESAVTTGVCADDDFRRRSEQSHAALAECSCGLSFHRPGWFAGDRDCATHRGMDQFAVTDREQTNRPVQCRSGRPLDCGGRWCCGLRLADRAARVGRSQRAGHRQFPSPSGSISPSEPSSTQSISPI